MSGEAVRGRSTSVMLACLTTFQSPMSGEAVRGVDSLDLRATFDAKQDFRIVAEGLHTDFKELDQVCHIPGLKASISHPARHTLRDVVHSQFVRFVFPPSIPGIPPPRRSRIEPKARQHCILRVTFMSDTHRTEAGATRIMVGHGGWPILKLRTGETAHWPGPVQNAGYGAEAAGCS